jgi:predicted nucleotidyltransferase
LAGIEKIGRVYPLDNEGFISNPTHAGLLVAPWKTVVDCLVEECTSDLGKDVHSIYVRGSIAAGTAVEGISDVDSIVVLRDFVGLPLPRWVEEKESEIQEKFDFLRGVEIVCVPRSQAVFPFHSRVPLLLKTQSLCVYGSDLIPDLPRYRPGIESMIDAPRLRASMEFVLSRMKQDISSDETIAYCRWLMKIIVRAGFEIIQERERVYTRDLFFCADGFLKYYSTKSSEMWNAVEWAVYPTSDKEQLTRYLRSFGSWLCTEVERRLCPAFTKNPGWWVGERRA